MQCHFLPLLCTAADSSIFFPRLEQKREGSHCLPERENTMQMHTLATTIFIILCWDLNFYLTLQACFKRHIHSPPKQFRKWMRITITLLVSTQQKSSKIRQTRSCTNAANSLSWTSCTVGQVNEREDRKSREVTEPTHVCWRDCVDWGHFILSAIPDLNRVSNGSSLWAVGLAT